MENEIFDPSIFGTSRSFKDWLLDKTNPLVYCLLTLDGKEFIRKNSYEVELHQKTNEHDTFSITVPDDALDSFKGYVMENSKTLLGKEIGISYWRFGEQKHSFRGFIGKIRNKKEEKSMKKSVPEKRQKTFRHAFFASDFASFLFRIDAK